MLFALRCRRAPSEKAVICFCHCLYQVLSHILGVSLLPSRRFHPLYAVPPPSSEGGEGAPAPRTDFSSELPSAGRCLPLFFCNQKKSRKTVKEKFRPLPSRSRVRLPPKGGINAPPETVWFLIGAASPMGSRAVFQYASDARPPEVLRTSRGYYFDSAAKDAHFARRLSRDLLGVRAPAVTTVLNIAVKPAEAGCPHPPAALSAAIAKTAKSPSLDMQNNIIIIINHFTRLEKPL